MRSSDSVSKGPPIHVSVGPAVLVPVGVYFVSHGIFNLCANWTTHPCTSQAIQYHWSIHGASNVCQSDHTSMCQLSYFLGANRVSILVPMGLCLEAYGTIICVPVELVILVPVELSIPLTMELFISATMDPSICVPLGPTIHVPVGGPFMKRCLPM